VILLFGGALLVTGLVDGRAGVRRLVSGLVKWRVGVTNTLLVTLALPVLTLLVAVATRSLRTPAGGWWVMALGYLAALAVGLLSTNLWEEAGWSGLVQTRLLHDHGQTVAALLTALPFALAHVPGAFENTPIDQAVVDIVAVAVLAPFLRHLAGGLLVDSAGSILAVGVLHASFKVSGRLSAAEGGWQFLAALVLLTLVAACRRRWTMSARGCRQRRAEGAWSHNATPPLVILRPMSDGSSQALLAGEELPDVRTVADYPRSSPAPWHPWSVLSPHRGPGSSTDHRTASSSVISEAASAPQARPRSAMPSQPPSRVTDTRRPRSPRWWTTPSQTPGSRCSSVTRLWSVPPAQEFWAKRAPC
jgi:membrane protease YdiL (CAAX protease family)